MSACPLCREAASQETGRHTRKGKRRCPAKDELICSQCCGSKRLVEIDCPDDCVYLGAHAGAWQGRETEKLRDGRRLAPHVGSLNEEQSQLFLMCVVALDGVRAARKNLTDSVALDALLAWRKTIETRSRGVLYEHEPHDHRAVGVLQDLQAFFKSQDEQGRDLSPADSDLLPVLRAVESALASTAQEKAGETAFLETVSRVAAEIKKDAKPAPAPRLILP